MCTDYAVFQEWVVAESQGKFQEWPLQPAHRIYTHLDWIGDAEEEISGAEEHAQPAMFELPAIDPDEFEEAYLWFLS